MSATTRLALESFWEHFAFALNGRAVVAWLVVVLLGRSRERGPRSWAWVLIWGGLRGGQSRVLALRLSTDFSHRGVLVTMTFGGVVISTLLQGFTAAPLLRKLGLAGRAAPSSSPRPNCCRGPQEEPISSR